MNLRLLWRHSTSALAVLACACLLALAPSPARAFEPPDAVTFGARIEAGDLAQARAWLDAGLDPNYVGERIGTGLMIAAWNGDLPMLRLFLERGADVNRSNSLDEQALMHAAWRGHLAAVDLLLDRGARIDNAPLRWGPLHYAVFGGHREVAARLLERGADINARSTNGSSVLMMAVYEGHETLAKDLLARGADPAIRNDRGDGALEWAFKFQRLGIARLVANREQFAAAANRPKDAWGATVRSTASPAAPSFEATRDEAEARIAELQEIRDTLAARGLKDAVKTMDRRIALMRSALLPAPGTALPARLGIPRTSQIDELMQMRSALAARGQKKAVAALDRRIAALRARKARAERETPAAALLEITARRASPEDQSVRLLFEPGETPP